MTVKRKINVRLEIFYSIKFSVIVRLVLIAVLQSTNNKAVTKQKLITILQFLTFASV